ncbi:metallophosphoesterase family protein [Aurantimonas sp. 22II-16-19i]|uniref:metallophosphoesterase family protein n=1 Tax=Aurantimonas sp. 22II-16-19i TaxID=1317114 RepID=UPI0009F7F661|nr:metallophosphoesterase family protein [Aurantimonas sp. 22II-16-19i]ORE98609.1 phosphodiesterase (yfcE) [Aurantimonas sp. 22II-16-19i]
MPRVGIISDTHGLLRPDALALLQGVSHIIHAGDIGAAQIVPRLAELAPVTAIRGNVDIAGWARRFPETVAVELFGRRFFVIHDRGDLAFDPAAEGYDAVISGHSHKPGIETLGGVMYLNPGSAGRRRFRLPVTVATVLVEGEGMVPAIHAVV